MKSFGKRAVQLFVLSIITTCSLKVCRMHVQTLENRMANWWQPIMAAQYVRAQWFFETGVTACVIFVTFRPLSEEMDGEIRERATVEFTGVTAQNVSIIKHLNLALFPIQYSVRSIYVRTVAIGSVGNQIWFAGLIPNIKFYLAVASACDGVCGEHFPAPWTTTQGILTLRDL